MESYRYLRLLVFLWLCTLFQIQAQNLEPLDSLSVTTGTKSWDIGLTLGAANAYGDLVDSRLIQFKRTNPAFGGFIRYNASRHLSLRASILQGKLEGADEDWTAIADRGLYFESTLTELALVGQWNFVGAGGTTNHTDGGIVPYLFAGIGVGLTEPNTDYSSILSNSTQEEKVAEDVANTNTSHFLVPLGIGVNIGLSDQLLLSLEYGLRPVFNDYLDGVSALGNPDRNDWYSMGGASIIYRLSGQGKDRDQDGIVDAKDRCPEDYGTRAQMGCPDTDQDGLADHLDQCPTLAGTQATRGCPDTDGDGISDSEDRCPRTPGSKAAYGCADQDGDGIPDLEDECVSVPGSAEFNGCRDTDKDGIADPKDRCPYEKGLATNEGCPAKEDKPVDTDGDGFVDEEDPCPQAAGVTNGCPDTDQDGLTDDVDLCPLVAGPRDRDGCPEINATDATILKTAVDNVSFHQGSYRLISSSHPTLDEIVDLLEQYPSYHLKIEGHTDNQGDVTANQRLSERRAQACMDYIHEQGGIALDRIISVGYGGAQPRATNDSQSGRRRNRRVEFKLFEPEE